MNISSGSGVNRNPLNALMSYQKNTTNVHQKFSSSDRVNISQEARDLSKEAQHGGSSSGFMLPNGLPLEAYSLPSWYADMSTGFFVLEEGMVGKPYSESKMSEYESLSSGVRSKVDKYEKTLVTTFESKLKEFGIEGTKDYYESVILNKEKSEEIHQAVKKELESDPEIKKIMNYFGIG